MYFLVRQRIINSKELTYLKDEDIYIKWRDVTEFFYDELNEVNSKDIKYIDNSFHSEEIEKQSENVFELLEVNDLVLVNGNNGEPYPSGVKWIPIIITEDDLNHLDELESWDRIKIYKLNKLETIYYLAWESE